MINNQEHAETELKIQKVTPNHLLRTCRAFLLRDPANNVLTLGDLYLPLFNMSQIYVAVENRKVSGVSSVFNAFSLPSIAIGTTTRQVKTALFKKALETISKDFITLDTPDQTSFYEEYATILLSYFEHQMILTKPKKAESNSNVNAWKAAKKDLEALNAFYMEHESPAWNPIQFETGPYYIVKHENKIVSAAGIHILTPHIAQLGNILTDKAHRQKGYSKACTNALVKELSRKNRIVSLFVRTDNTAAIHMYEQIGFRKAKTINFLIMRKNNTMTSN